MSEDTKPTLDAGTLMEKAIDAPIVTAIAIGHARADGRPIINLTFYGETLDDKQVEITTVALEREAANMIGNALLDAAVVALTGQPLTG
jgi:hypothetical protein